MRKHGAQNLAHRLFDSAAVDLPSGFPATSFESTDRSAKTDVRFMGRSEKSCTIRQKGLCVQKDFV